MKNEFTLIWKTLIFQHRNPIALTIILFQVYGSIPMFHRRLSVAAKNL